MQVQAVIQTVCKCELMHVNLAFHIYTVVTAWNNLPASVFDVVNVYNFRTCLNAVTLVN